MKYIGLFLSIIITTQTFAQIYPFPENGKWGYINSAGKIVVQPTYQSAGRVIEGMAKISIVNDRDEYVYGFINSAGSEVIPPKFSSASDFDGGVARVKIRNNYHFLLKNGSVVTSQSYDAIKPATNGIAIFKKDGLYGYAYTNGRAITSSKFTSALPFSTEGLAVVSTNSGRSKTYGIINRQGKFIVEPKYDDAKSFVNGFGAIQHGKDWYVIDTKGQPIIEEGFNDVGQFENNLINVKKGSSWGYINSIGDTIIDFDYDIADKFSKGLAVVGNKKYFSFINTSGELVAPIEFTRVTRFDGKLARVSQGKKNGFMNATGRFNITDKISSIGSFISGRARMKAGNYFGYYDTTAKLAIRPQFLYASDFSGDLALTVALIEDGYRISYINKSGKIVKSWNSTYQPILKNKEIFYSMIYPSVPFYRDNSPSSKIIIRANYADTFEKTYQRTATPLLGHGLNGLLYSAEYYARPGFIFSEVVTRYNPPQIGMGITQYFREQIGVLYETDSPTSFSRPLNAVFFNATTLNRTVSRSTVYDKYTVPFMRISEAFFLLTAALGYPSSEYPTSSGNLPNYLSKSGELRFSGRFNSDDKPTEFTLSLGRSRVRVKEGHLNVEIEYTYPRPEHTSDSIREPIFTSNPKDAEFLEEELTILSNVLMDTNYTLTNKQHTDIIIEEVETTNSIDLTEAVIQDQISNSTAPVIQSSSITPKD